MDNPTKAFFSNQGTEIFSQLNIYSNVIIELIRSTSCVRFYYTQTLYIKSCGGDHITLRKIHWVMYRYFLFPEIRMNGFLYIGHIFMLSTQTNFLVKNVLSIFEALRNDYNALFFWRTHSTSLNICKPVLTSFPRFPTGA